LGHDWVCLHQRTANGSKQQAVINWTLVHSTVGFAVKHMLFSTVRGKFNDVRATAQIDEQTGSLRSVNAEISVASVDTDNAKRDGHLRSGDFFNAERYPTITFESTSIEPEGNGNYRVDGILTIRDVSKPITLEGKTIGKDARSDGV
jgi:polyisoprenoid-binding protein YceI